MTEQTIQQHIATILGNQMIQIVSMQAQIEALSAQLQAAMAAKPQEEAEKK